MAPSRRFSNNVETGTRVPRNTQAPLHLLRVAFYGGTGLPSAHGLPCLPVLSPILYAVVTIRHAAVPERPPGHRTPGSAPPPDGLPQQNAPLDAIGRCRKGGNRAHNQGVAGSIPARPPIESTTYRDLGATAAHRSAVRVRSPAPIFSLVFSHLRLHAERDGHGACSRRVHIGCRSRSCGVPASAASLLAGHRAAPIARLTPPSTGQVALSCRSQNPMGLSGPPTKKSRTQLLTRRRPARECQERRP